MTTFTTVAPGSMLTSTAFQTWVQEIINALNSQCGLGMCPFDTGQINTSTVQIIANQYGSGAGGGGVGQTTYPTYLSLGYSMFAFNDTLAEGGISATGAQPVVTNSGTAAYCSGGTVTVTGVSLTYAANGGRGSTGGSATGSGAVATVVLTSSGLITSVTITSVGTGYMPGDSLTFTNANLALGSKTGAGTLTGTGAGAVIVVTNTTGANVFFRLDYGYGSNSTVPGMWITVSNTWLSNGVIGATGAVNAYVPTIGGYGYNGGGGALSFSTYNGTNTGFNGGGTATHTVTPTGGTGTGLTVSIVVTSGVCAAPTVVSAGTGYLAADILTFNSAIMVAGGFAAGGGTITCTINALTGAHAAVANVPMVGGNGSGFTLNLTLQSGGTASTNSLQAAGTGYAVGDQLTLTNSNSLSSFGTATTTGYGSSTVGSTLTIRVTAITYATNVLMTYMAQVLANVGFPSTTSSYPSRYLWNPTYGACGMAWKAYTASLYIGGFYLWRSTSSSAVPTADSINLLTSNFSYSAIAANLGAYQMLSTLTNTSYPTAGGVLPTVNNTGYWFMAGTLGPFGNTSSYYNGNAYIIPISYYTPVPAVAATCCVAMITDAPMHSQFSCAIVGSSALNFVSCAGMFGSSTLGQQPVGVGGSFCMLWQ